MLSFSELLFIRLHYNAGENALADLNGSSSDLIAAGGLMVNLMLDGRIRLDKDQLTIVDSRPTNDPLLDEALARLAGIGRIDRENPEWFQAIVHTLPMGIQLFQTLTEKGVIYRQQKKGFMGLSKTILFPFQDANLPATLFESERAVMLHGASPDKLTAARIFMAYCWGAQKPWELSRPENKQYDNRFEAIFGDYWGWYGDDTPTEAIEGLTPELQYNMADLSISWATVHMVYVADDVRFWRDLLG